MIFIWIYVYLYDIINDSGIHQNIDDNDEAAATLHPIILIMKVPHFLLVLEFERRIQVLISKILLY